MLLNIDILVYPCIEAFSTSKSGLRYLVHTYLNFVQTVKHTLIDKVYDAFISRLSGAHGLVESNTRLRSDPALQTAFGRSCCAEQSVVQETLDWCTAENVSQMELALESINRQCSQGYRHEYARHYQILDVDMSGMPCGPKAAFESLGYFAKQRNRRGRQLGRVLAWRYDEACSR